MKNILIVTPGKLPVPAIKGGAVETLIEMIVSENEIEPSFKIDVFTLWDDQVNTFKYKHSKLITVKSCFPIRVLDCMYFNYWEKIKKDWRVTFHRNQFRNGLYEKRLSKVLKVNRYDRIIVENNMSLLKIIFETVGEEIFSRTCDYHMHSALIDNPLMLQYLRKCNQIITVSDFVRNAMKSTYIELSSVNFSVLRNTVDASVFNQNSLEECRERVRKKYNISSNTYVFLYSGRLSIEKGIRELVKAFGNLKSDLAKLVIAGGSYSGDPAVSQYEKNLKEFCLENKLNVVFLGYIDNKDMKEIYALADTLVIPSLAEEAGSLTAIEGKQLGIPMIVSRVGSLPEYLGEYPTYVMPGESFVDELSSVMQQYLDEDKLGIRYKTEQTLGSRWYFEQFTRIID